MAKVVLDTETGETFDYTFPTMEPSNMIDWLVKSNCFDSDSLQTICTNYMDLTFARMFMKTMFDCFDL